MGHARRSIASAFLALGHYDNGSGPLFNMTALALRTAGCVNGVSQLHGEVTREMWAPIWPGVADDQLPVAPSPTACTCRPGCRRRCRRCFDEHLGTDWREHARRPGVVGARHRDPRRGALGSARRRCATTCSRSSASGRAQRWTEEHVSAARVVAAGTLLDPDALTIGFARRFTGYKRPELIFHDPERLVSILTAAPAPVQIVFAGKAHPADETGKHHLQQVYRRAIDPMFGGRIAFVDDYDLHVAHFLVQGCDVWLNNPRKPLEAAARAA